MPARPTDKAFRPGGTGMKRTKMQPSVFAAIALVAACGGLALALADRDGAAPKPSAPLTKPGRHLPGIRIGGVVQLPNGWSLRPAGRQVPLGDLPVNMALHPKGRWLAVLHAGYGTHEVMVFDLQENSRGPTCRVTLEQTFYGLCFAPDGKTLYASGGEFETVHAFAFEEGLLGRRNIIRVANLLSKFIPAGLATDADGRTLYAAGTWGHAVALVPLDNPDRRRHVSLEKESYPYACLPEPGGKRLFVSLWGKAAIAVIDLEKGEVASNWTTESHPTEMALSPDGKTLFVACSNSTRVSVLDVANGGKVLETINCALFPTSPSGNTPSSLSLTPDGQVLFVANADANNVAVLQVAQPGHSKPLGFIPVGWYPTSVRYEPNKKRIYVANAKGLSSRANVQGPGPYDSSNLRPAYEYIARLFHGTLGIINMPEPDKLAEYSKQAYACSPLRRDVGVTAQRPEGSPIPGKVGEGSPIKYCIYIVKENRTYDQVFGDVKEGNGDPNLCLFGEKTTPNHHKLAREFVLLDNFYVEGEVSADGHQWTMGAYATDFVEKVWPLTYRGSPLRKLAAYPSEGEYDSIARPAGGYLWDRCAEAGVSYRSYGEWVADGKTPKDPAKPRVKALEGHIDPHFRGFDLDYPDQKRADRFIEELQRFERDGGMPRFTVLRLPNDHTAGTKVGSKTPRAMMADNDLALGRVVEAVSKSKFWKETAIFVVEDDAQNGPDHVDAHRTLALVISPHVKRGVVDSSMYSTSSMVRTIELILGLKPMSQFDAAARPMYASFQAKTDTTTYRHVVPEVDLEETNKATAWGAKLSETFDLAKEDAADDLLLNEVVWRSIKGADCPMPAPVRAAFVMPSVKKDRDDDD
jgi:DNA-binding beta-propeller fold protein YncE